MTDFQEPENSKGRSAVRRDYLRVNASPPNDSSIDKATKACRECASQIPISAVVCSQCEAPQNWSRYIRRWAGVGTAIAGVIPVWVGAWSLMKMAQGSVPAELGVVAPECKRDKVSLAVTNSGGEAAMISRIDLAVSGNGGRGTQNVEMGFDRSKSVVEPGKVTFMELSGVVAGRVLPELPRRNLDGCQFSIIVSWQEFKGGNRSRGTTCACPE